MGWVRSNRRAVVVAVLAFVALAEAALGAAVLTAGDDAPPPLEAVPLHPIAGSFEPDGTTLAECSHQACYEQAFGNLAYRAGPKRALAALEREVGTNTNACHRVAHIIGSASLARYDGNVGRTFAEGSPTCFSGYYHGVLERSLVNVKSYAANALGAVARGLCNDPAVRRVAELEYQCLHGLGHGLMITTGYNLPIALRVCDFLDTSWETTSCNGGVFMENMSTSYGVRSRFVREDDPVYPCNWVAKADKLTCYQLVTSRILQVVGVDWEATARICAGVEKGWVQACFQSYGRDAAGQTRRDPEQILEACEIARPYGGERACVRFAAMDLTGNDSSGRSAAAFCTFAPAYTREACFDAVGAIMGRFRATSRARVADCRSLNADAGLVKACIRGSGTTVTETTDR
jgi:hypothetical protein